MCDRWPNPWSSPVGGVDAYMECRILSLLIETGFEETGGGNGFFGTSAILTGLCLNYTNKEKHIHGNDYVRNSYSYILVFYSH